MRYLELFSGIGGFRRAAECFARDTGIEMNCVGFSEIDKYATQTYLSNYQTGTEIVMNDITRFAREHEQIAALPDIDLILGGFPCQSFSLLGKKLGLEDERGQILFSIHEILQVKQPRFLVFENVRNIVRHDKGKTLGKIKQFFHDNGYQFVETVLLDTQNFGLPQKRSRLFFVCCRDRLNIELTEERIVQNFQGLAETSLQTYQGVREILERNTHPKYYLSEKIKHTILADGSGNFWSKSQIDQPVARTLTATMVKMHRACQDNYYSDDFINEERSHQDTDREILYHIPVRRLTPGEALKLQGFDDHFYRSALAAGVSEHQLYKQAGNALSVNTGYALLHYLFAHCRIQEQ